MATTAPDMDPFVDNQPMNDEELTKLHESTLQMFRSNKIGPKNAFDIVLIDYLPAIFEATSFDDDHMNNFQSVGTTLETSGSTQLKLIKIHFRFLFQQRSMLPVLIHFTQKLEKLSQFSVQPMKISIESWKKTKKILMELVTKKIVLNDESQITKKFVY